MLLQDYIHFKEKVEGPNIQKCIVQSIPHHDSFNILEAQLLYRIWCNTILYYNTRMLDHLTFLSFFYFIVLTKICFHNYTTFKIWNLYHNTQQINLIICLYTLFLNCTLKVKSHNVRVIHYTSWVVPAKVKKIMGGFVNWI